MSAVGVTFKMLGAENVLHVIVEVPRKLLSYAKGRQSQILKALDERCGNRFQKFSGWKIFARDYIISK